MSADSSAAAVSLTTETFRVWVIHYTKLVERRAHMERVLAAADLERFSLTWMLEHDREALSASALADWAMGAGDPRGLGVIGGPLNAGHVSVIRKHLSVLAEVAASDLPFHLILEDDVELVPGLVERLERLLKGLPADWEIVFVGDGCRLHVPWWRRWWADRRLRQAGVFFRGWQPTWWGGGGMSRCGAGYLVRPASARRFLGSVHAQPPFEVPIDWLMNRVGQDLNFRSYWAEPPLVNQDVFESWTKQGTIE